MRILDETIINGIYLKENKFVLDTNKYRLCKSSDLIDLTINFECKYNLGNHSYELVWDGIGKSFIFNIKEDNKANSCITREILSKSLNNELKALLGM